VSSRDLTADGSIRVEQEGRLATGAQAVYTGADRLLVVTGNVRVREADGSWLRADKVLISLADETFEAVGNVETEFSLKRGK
jgi:lipopolysaccharide export system protein LptA